MLCRIVTKFLCTFCFFFEIQLIIGNPCLKRDSKGIGWYANNRTHVLAPLLSSFNSFIRGQILSQLWIFCSKIYTSTDSQDEVTKTAKLFNLLITKVMTEISFESPVMSPSDVT